MTFYDQAQTAFEMTWVPEGYEELDRFETNGAVQLEWYREGEILTWQYVTDPLCPWELPEREPGGCDRQRPAGPILGQSGPGG